MKKKSTPKNQIKPGDFYQDCGYHPVLCTKADAYEVEGISLIDGSSPRCCSTAYCKPRKISFRTAIRIKTKGPSTAQKAHTEALNKSADWDFKIWWETK